MIIMDRKVLVIGGAGFIGTNICSNLARKGFEICVLDNLSRKGTDENLKWLKDSYDVDFVDVDIRTDRKELEEAVEKADLVYHLAAQVAVTTSVKDPREDFEINALGTFNVLEAVRKANSDATLIFSSTNKVYGGIEKAKVVEKEKRYEYKDYPNGISEEMNLDFHSPYGCSKGCADQYVRDYSRIYGLNSVVFRQSCIYGKRQFGVEDQGWVAWFTIASVLEKPITVYGDGKQVRDILYADDLVNAFELASQNISKTKGRIYNIGGGKNNTLSLLELIDFLEEYSGKNISPSFDEWRPGDQKVFVADISKAEKDFGWKPKTSPKQGVKELFDWVSSNKEMVARVLDK
jgi:CDP-paratose 2-epimerase